MALTYVLDEHLRGPLWKAIQHHNAAGLNPIDTVRVGDPPGLPLGTLDPDLLLWAQQQGRVLVSLDFSTMPGHLAAHLGAGHHSPGVFILRPGQSLSEAVRNLVLAAYVYDPVEVQDQIRYVP